MEDQHKYLISLVNRSEEGDLDALLELATLFLHGDGVEKHEDLGLEFLHRYYFLRGKRLDQIATDPAPAEALREMVEDAFEPGSEWLIPEVCCHYCPLEPAPMRVSLGRGRYRTLEGFAGFALRSAEMFAQNLLPPCESCGDILYATFVDCYSPRFHESDLLCVRVIPEEGTADAVDYGLLWWHRSGVYTTLPSTIPDETDSCLMTLERAAQLVSDGQEDMAAQVLKHCLERFRGDPCLVHACLLLGRPNNLGLAERIARAHTVVFPDDPLGYLRLAEVLVRGLAANGMIDDVLEEARDLVRKSLDLRPDWKDALLLECMVESLRPASIDSLVRMYQSLTSAYPDFAAAHFDFGLLSLGFDESMGRRHLAEAERLAEPLCDVASVRAEVLAKMKSQRARNNRRSLSSMEHSPS